MQAEVLDPIFEARDFLYNALDPPHSFWGSVRHFRDTAERGTRMR